MFSHDIFQSDVQELKGNSWILIKFQHFHLFDVDFSVLSFNHKLMVILGGFMTVEIVGTNNWCWNDFFDLRKGFFQ